MKRAITICLSYALLLTLCACGNSNKKAFEAANEAFGNIDKAYNMVEDFGSDVYEAWRLAIYEDDDISVKFLAGKLALSENEINAAIDEVCGINGVGDMFFTLYNDNLFSACVIMVSKAYELNGRVDEIDGYLLEAKGQMKEMSEKYSDYEHYANLKGYYTTTNAFFEFCQNPTGSFNQVVDTINNYKNDARDFRNDLAYIFEE